MQIWQSFQNIFKIPELRTRILWTFGLLIVYRLGSHIPLPGVNPAAVAAWNDQMQREGGDLFGLIQVFTGGAIGNLALFSLGIMPYITSSIIMQLMTKVSPNLEAIAKEGPSGQQAGQGKLALLVGDHFGSLLFMMIGMSAGALFIMWLGEQITERGIGN